MYVLLVLVLVPISLAAHSTTVSVSPTSSYEIIKNLYNLNVINNGNSSNIIKEVTINLDGATLVSDEVDSGGWVYNVSGNSITFYSMIGRGGSQPFYFNATNNEVNSDTAYTWDIDTKDVNNMVYSNQVSVTILNDANPPNITSNIPIDYSFIKNDTINFLVTVTEAETIINPNYFFVGYDDNNNTQTAGAVKGTLQLNPVAVNQYGNSLNPNELSVMDLTNGATFLDYRFTNLSDAAGNKYLEAGFVHHLFVDSETPSLTSGLPNNGTIDKVSLQSFTFDLDDNSFDSNGQGSFSPQVSCSLYIDGNNVSTTVYTNSQIGASFLYNLTSDDVHTWYIICQDLVGYTQQSAVRTFTLDSTGPDVILISPTAGSVIHPGTTIDFNIVDTYSGVSDFSSSVGTLNASYDINTTGWAKAIYNIVITTNDTLNNINSETFSFTINNVPQIDVIDQTINEDTPATIDLDTFATDADGDPLIYTVTAENIAEVDCSIVANILTMTPALDWNGVASCSVKANDGLSDSAEDSFAITVSYVNDIPTLTAVSPLVGEAGEVISFTSDANDVDIVYGDSLTYSWDFGDGNTSTTQNPTKTYDSTGNFNVNLIITDNSLATANVAQIVVISDTKAPSLTTTYTASITAGTNLDVSANINDPSGVLEALLHYESNLINLSSNYNWVITSPSVGTHNFVISVKDNLGNAANTTYSFTVTSAGGGGGGGGGGGSHAGGGIGSDCIINWECSAWTSCSSTGTQTRNCFDTNGCNAEQGTEVRPCVYEECSLDSDCEAGDICVDHECVLNTPSVEPEEGMTGITGAVILSRLRANPAKGTAFLVAIAILVGMWSYVLHRRVKKSLVNANMNTIREDLKNNRIR